MKRIPEEIYEQLEKIKKHVEEAFMALELDRGIMLNVLVHGRSRHMINNQREYAENRARYVVHNLKKAFWENRWNGEWEEGGKGIIIAPEGYTLEEE
tara:strand:+ start:1321 stop:1611 length:291 start_codon:yes stop_codon:yes gene_type:complete